MRFVKKLDLYVLKNFLMLFMGTFVICLFIVMMQFLWKHIDDLVGKGLSFEVLGKFFFYAAETLVGLALPLAILLASLISFGNMGERLELLAVKAAGVSLWRMLRSLIVVMAACTAVSFYFQNVVAPEAWNKLLTMLYTIRQKSPELDIPEGVFYDGVEGMNLFVNHKDKKTGMLYGVIIYNMRDGVDRAHVLLADSGRLESSADKQHLLLHLWNGEQFENLRENMLKTNNVPYRRETFVGKDFIIDFNQNFDMTDADFSGSARTKNTDQLEQGIDSLAQVIDSTSRMFYEDMKRGTLYVPEYLAAEAKMRHSSAPAATSEAGVRRNESGSAAQSTPATGQGGGPSRAGGKAKAQAAAPVAAVADLDSLFGEMPQEEQTAALRRSLQRVQMTVNDLEFRVEIMKDYHKDYRLHEVQIWQKFTLALACLIFFFIGAPLGAIIRKGGLGMPIVVAVVIFIFYYIIDKLGYNLAYSGTVPPAVGMLFSTVVLAPIGAFLTIKSNNDSVVFNIDSYIQFFRKLWGIRTHRYITSKEVVIYSPDYAAMADELRWIAAEAYDYRRTQHLTRFPNYLHIYFQRQRDERIEQLSNRLEYCIESLSNSRNSNIVLALNEFPVLDAHAHTAPFSSKSWNIAAGILFPVGIGLLFRMSRFRRRLRKDLQQIRETGTKLAVYCDKEVEQLPAPSQNQ